GDGGAARAGVLLGAAEAAAKRHGGSGFRRGPAVSSVPRVGARSVRQRLRGPERVRRRPAGGPLEKSLGPPRQRRAPSLPPPTHPEMLSTRLTPGRGWTPTLAGVPPPR